MCTGSSGIAPDERQWPGWHRSSATGIPAVPWQRIVGMRDVMVHGCFQVDWDAVWAVAARVLGPLGVAMRDVMQAEGWEAD